MGPFVSLAEWPFEVAGGEDDIYTFAVNVRKGVRNSMSAYCEVGMNGRSARTEPKRLAP